MYSKTEGYIFTNSLGEIEEVKNTYKLQLQSLQNFAFSLGYAFDEPLLRFERYIMGKTAYKVVSFNKMVYWHNTRFMPTFHHGLERELPNQSKLLRLPQENMQKAIDSKLIKQVHLQASKGKKNRNGTDHVGSTIVVQSHLIKFA